MNALRRLRLITQEEDQIESSRRKRESESEKERGMRERVIERQTVVANGKAS